jgi:exopolyphosphatase/guanosine-5'-triphosphate,3'-diphosphate pyrophosphatase
MTDSNDNIAAIDLGSNSFHMIVARVVDDHVQILDRLKEMVQLAAGLDERHRLAPEAQERALDCLARFGQRLRHIPGPRIRIVGTNTLRRARNSQEFLTRAQTVLGHAVEIISGMEEARLIYLGVTHSNAGGADRRLVVDIGGGSTEVIIGERFEPLHLESLHMGCVSMTRRYFPDGVIRKCDLQTANLHALRELAPVRSGFQDSGWSEVIGASGTVKAIEAVAVHEGWSREGITATALEELRGALLDAGSAKVIARRWDLTAERARVFAGGFTVLRGLFEALGVTAMKVSEGALREGVIFDLLGRIRHEDVRDRTIATLSRRYGIDEAQARRVTATAQGLLDQVRGAWELDDGGFDHDLEWAARLHEIGLAFAHSKHHQHGAYVLRHSDLPGFSRRDQELLAALVHGHRRKFPKAVFKALPKGSIRSAWRLCVLLRLAVLLHRGRSSERLPPIRLQARKDFVELRFPPGWLGAHPLTRADLETEAANLQKAKIDLSIS